MRRIFVRPEFAFLLIGIFAVGAWYLISSAITSVNQTAEAYNAAVEKSANGVAPSSVTATSAPSI